MANLFCSRRDCSFNSRSAVSPLRHGWLIIIGIGSSSSCAQVLSNDIDLLHPPVELERRKHKLKRLVQSPNSFFMVSFIYISLVLACVSVFQQLLPGMLHHVCSFLFPLCANYVLLIAHNMMGRMVSLLASCGSPEFCSRCEPPASELALLQQFICFANIRFCTTVFSHSQTVVVCGSCSTVLCQPTGGKARLTEGCSFRKKGD
ncbi:unnamed protein product [Sphagnum jensenii]|uniref:40S ribosomal protein S27 n=1 Tax=Sphagnum jensenii TaxID=128206 RepID=A0ABP1B1N2_9BRYO